MTTKTSTLNRYQDHGFTLIELIVVMTIIGLMASVSALSFRKPNSDKGPIFTWASEFGDTIKYVNNSATLAQKQFAIQFSTKKIRFLEYSDSKWVISKNKYLKKIVYPENSNPSLSINSVSLNLPDNLKKITPHVLMLSSMETTPFKLLLSDDQGTHAIKLNSLGEYKYVP